METREARNLFISTPPPPLSLYLFCRARCCPECRLVVCKFFGMSARACNNFMEISSPAKHSHRVSRASNATRIEKRGKREEKKARPVFYSTLLVGRWHLSRYVDIEKGTTFMCLSRIHPRFARTNFFCFLSPSFFHPRSRRYTVCINDTPECNSRRR